MEYNNTNNTAATTSKYLFDDLEDHEIYELIYNEVRPKLWTWISIFCHVLVFIFGLIGNALVCIAVYRNRSMRTVTNYFIMNLAIADFLVILICLPTTHSWDVAGTWFFGDIACKVILYLQTVSVTVSVLTLTFISIERWYAICFPLKFKTTVGRAKLVILIIWTISLLFDIPELVMLHTKEQDLVRVKTIFFTQCKSSWSDTNYNIWILLKFLLLYLIPLIIMAATYCHIIFVLWKPKENQHKLVIMDDMQLYTFAMPVNASTRGQLRSRKKAAKMLISVVVMFAVCFFPVHLYNILRIVAKLRNTVGNKIFASVSHWLCYANSAVNPLIYNFMSGKFRKEFKRSYECCKTSRSRNELPRVYKNDSSSKSRTLSKQSKRCGSDIKRTDTITTKVTE